MIRYIPLFEKAMREYKAWYSPSSNKFIQFSTNGLHEEIAEQKLHMTSDKALRSGYVRIAVMTGVNIETWTAPDEREFKAIQEKIDMNTIKGQVHTMWEMLKDGTYRYFPKDSFFYAEGFENGQLR